MSENRTAAQRNWGSIQVSADEIVMNRCEEVAADVEALVKHVAALESRRNADVEALMQHINELCIRVQNIESRGADAGEPDVDDIRVVGVFQEPALDVALVIKAIRLYGDDRAAFEWNAARGNKDAAGHYAVSAETRLAAVRDLLEAAIRSYGRAAR